VRSNAPRSARSLTKAQLVEEVERLRERLARTDGPGRESSGTEEAERFRRELAEAVDKQTATSDILRVISRSQTDVQPVFDAIVESAVRLCDARWGAVFRYDGELVHAAAHHNFSEEQQAAMALQYPMTPTPAHISRRAILTGATAQIPDIALDAQYGSALATQYGYRSLLGVPILRAGAPIGCDRHLPQGARTVRRPAHRPAADLRRPGGDRHRERALVHGVTGEESGSDQAHAQVTEAWSSRPRQEKSYA
jgi:hypothetical protein